MSQLRYYPQSTISLLSDEVAGLKKELEQRDAAITQLRVRLRSHHGESRTMARTQPTPAALHNCSDARARILPNARERARVLATAHARAPMRGAVRSGPACPTCVTRLPCVRWSH